MGANAWLIWTAPVITIRGAGKCNSRKCCLPSTSISPLFPRRNCVLKVFASGSLPISFSPTRRCAPFSISVTITAARRATRSAFRATIKSRRIKRNLALVDFLDIDADSTAARKANFPGGFVSYAKFEKLRLSALDHIHRFRNYGAFHTTARNRTKKIIAIIDDEMAAYWTRSGTPGFDYGRNRDTAHLTPPSLGRSEHVVLCRLHFRIHTRSPSRRNSLIW